jgi:transcriptional regulator with XRE-family HTH domain
LDFSEWIVKNRTEKQLSQEQLAENLDVTRQAISQWERGIRLPDITNLVKLFIVFEFDSYSKYDHFVHEVQFYDDD